MTTAIEFDGTALAESLTFDTFGCRVFRANPDTPDRLTPDVTLTRKFYSNKITMPDGNKVEIWGFEDPSSKVRAPFPSAPIRVRQGQLVHSTIKANKGSHTIHHHAINGSPFNDGVGHTSFEVNGSYTFNGPRAKPAPTSTTATRTQCCTSRWACTGC